MPQSNALRHLFFYLSRAPCTTAAGRQTAHRAKAPGRHWRWAGGETARTPHCAAPAGSQTFGCRVRSSPSGSVRSRQAPPGSLPRGRQAPQSQTLRRLLYCIRHEKGSIRSGCFLFVVRPSGFEPLAYRVGVCHSIQLSYGRIFSRRYYSKVRAKCKAGFSVPIWRRICYTGRKKPVSEGHTLYEP